MPPSGGAVNGDFLSLDSIPQIPTMIQTASSGCVWPISSVTRTVNSSFPGRFGVQASSRMRRQIFSQMGVDPVRFLVDRALVFLDAAILTECDTTQS
jgi:hypothetical protein